MGQYYNVVNLDKKEVLLVEGKHPGRKLLEIAETKTESLGILNQIAEQWKGDHVYLIGDYACFENGKNIYDDVIREWSDKLHLTDSIYRYAEDECKTVEGNPEDQGYRFIYNHDRKEYIDMAHCPRYCDGADGRQEYIAPLPLLIAIGNGLGSGDYRGCNNEDLVGTWCDSIASVEITKQPNSSTVVIPELTGYVGTAGSNVAVRVFRLSQQD